MCVCVRACVLKTVNMFSSDKTKMLWFVDKFLKCGGGLNLRRIAEIKLYEKLFWGFPVKRTNKEAQRRAWKTMLYTSLLLSNGNHVYLFPQYVKDFLLVVHSALILYSLPRRVSLGTILYRSRYTPITFRISVQKKLWCLLFRELETLPASMYILRMALLIRVIIKVLCRADLKFFKSVNKAKN